MADFYRNETVVCSVEWRSAGTLTDPLTSISVQVSDLGDAILLDWTAMTKDAVGKYHYDYTISTTAAFQNYKVRFRAIDSGRTTIAQETYKVVL